MKHVYRVVLIIFFFKIRNRRDKAWKTKETRIRGEFPFPHCKQMKYTILLLIF